MGKAIGTVILGILISVLGFCNRRGNLSSIHWYHRKRITEENKLPFGKAVGLGTILCGASLSLFGVLSFLAEKTQLDLLAAIGSVILAIGLAVGLALSLYAIIKYNKGLF